MMFPCWIWLLSGCQVTWFEWSILCLKTWLEKFVSSQVCELLWDDLDACFMHGDHILKRRAMMKTSTVYLHISRPGQGFFRMLFAVYSKLELNVFPWCWLLLTEPLIYTTLIATIQIYIIDLHISTAFCIWSLSNGHDKIVWNRTNLSYLSIAPRWNDVSARY
jgi:hypothetical protein